MTCPTDDILLRAFRSGVDTFDIAERFGLPESFIEAAVHRARNAERTRRTERAA